MKNKEKQAVLECYKRLYEKASPSADYEKLVEKFNEINKETILEYEKGKVPTKELWRFIDEHFLSQEEQNEIIEDVIKKFKIQPEFKRNIFKTTIVLGASPRYCL